MADHPNEMIRRAGEVILKAIEESECNFGPEGIRLSCEDAARAVFDLIREPSEEMIEAGEALVLISGTASGCWSNHNPTPEDAWKAMIEEMLK